MKTYTRNARFWHQTRHHFAMRSQLWGKGSEAAALLEIAQDDNWQEAFINNAPASRQLSPDEVAQFLINRFLS